MPLLLIRWSSENRLLVVIATLVLAALFALLAHLVVQREIYRMDCLEGLKVKE